MGNATVKGYWPPPGMVTIVLLGGRTEQYDRPVSAGDIMLRHPRHHVVRPDFFRSSPANVLKPEEVLTPGHKFFLVSFQTVTKKLRIREERLLRSSSHSSTCRGSIDDCTKASIGVGKRGATRIPAGRLTILRKSSLSPARSTRQARKTLLQKEILSSRRRPSIDERRRTPLKSHMRKKSADSEAAFEPPPDVAELEMFDSEDYSECIPFESSVVLPKPAPSSVLSIPEYESFQSCARSSINVESLLTSVKDQETSKESPGTPKLEELIFKEFIPAKIFFNPSGRTSVLREASVEKQPEQSSKGYVLRKPLQPASIGCASLADHILQGVDSPKATRPASDKCVSFDGKMQKGVDSHKAARPVLDKCVSFDGKMQKGVDSHKAARPVLDKCVSFDGTTQKGVDSHKAARPVLDNCVSFDGKMQKGVDSHKAARPVLDKCVSFDGKMQKEVDSPSEPLLAVSELVSTDAPLEKRVHFSKPGRPFLYGIASADYFMPKRVDSAGNPQSRSRLQDYRKSEDLDSSSDSPKPAAFSKWAPLSEQLSVKIAAHPQPAITNKGGPDALGQQQQPPSREKSLVSYLRETERPFIPTFRSVPQQPQKEGSEEQVGSLKVLPLFYTAPGFPPGKGTIEVKSHNSRSALKSLGSRPPVHPQPIAMVKQATLTTLVKKQTPALGNKLINHLCFAPQQGSESPLRPAAAAAAVVAAASGVTQAKQSASEQGLKLIDHLKRDQNSPPNQQNILKQSPATRVNLQIQAPYIVPIPKSGSTGSGKEGEAQKELVAFRKELVAFQLRQTMKSATLRCNNANEALTTSIEANFLKLPPAYLLRNRRIRTRSRVYSAAHWKPRLSPLVEFSPTHSELSVKS